MEGIGPFAQVLAKRFRLVTKRLGLKTSMTRLRCDLFEAPQGAREDPSKGRKATQRDQLDLFGPTG